MKNFWLLLLLLLLGVSVGGKVGAQNLLPDVVQDYLEELSARDESAQWEDEIEIWTTYLEQPLNLNTATREQLESFSFLTDLQIEGILAYVYLHGPMQTVYELQLVETMDRTTVDLLLPFVCVETGRPQNRPLPSVRTLLRDGKSEVVSRLDIPFYRREGYRNHEYGGQPFYHSLRYQFRYGDCFRVGMTAEKDAGEPFFAAPNRKGYDFYRPYALIRARQWLRTLALGSYRLNFGQGLVVSNSFLSGKTFSLLSVNPRTTSVRSHTGTDEINYFNGAAVQIQPLKQVSVSSFYSYRKLDGTVEDGLLTSIQQSGLHRTQAEQHKRNAVGLQTLGGHVQYERPSWQVGATAMYYRFSLPYRPRRAVYSKYDLQGQHFHNLGFDYRVFRGKFEWAGEGAKGRYGFAWLNKATFRLSSDYRFMLLHRWYSKDYWSFFGRSFSEGGSVQNEKGWYLAAEIAPLERWKFFGSVDFFSFPWWRYRISQPSHGTDVMLRADYQKGPVAMQFQYRYKQKDRDVADTQGETVLPTYLNRFRYRWSYQRGAWQLKTTAQFTVFSQLERQGGFLLSQQATYRPACSPWQVMLQGTYFDTDDYDTRQYLYEQGLLYTFNSYSFSGKGYRLAATARFRAGRGWWLLAKIGRTYYTDRSQIGQGNDLIGQPGKTDLQLQTRLTF